MAGLAQTPLARQQPEWPDPEHYSAVLLELRERDPLVSPTSIDTLTDRLGAVATGEAILLQAGPCAESLSDGEDEVRSLLNVMLPMTVVLMYSAELPVVKVGRLAGQYAKPRSFDTEEVDGIELPSFRGEAVNDYAFNVEARRPNPERLLLGYDHSKSTLKTLGQLTSGGFADIERMHDWNVKFAASSSQSERYQVVAGHITKAIHFLKASGVNANLLSELHEAEMFVSHEALLLGYEQALTRNDNGKSYDLSSHMLWIGDRTRALDEAHVAFCSEIENPIGVKIGPTATIDDVLGLSERLNPNRIPGRLIFVSRMGEDNIANMLPPLLKASKKGGHSIIWSCDPMHGNTFTTESGHKTRKFDSIVEETKRFYEICESEDVWPGGLHLEITGENVTECLGGSDPHTVLSLDKHYTTMCDPRLNPTQSIELAFRVADLLLHEK